MRVVTLDIETSLREPWTETDAAGKPTFPPLPLHVPEIICWLTAWDGALELHAWDRAAETEQTGLCRLDPALRVAERLFNLRGMLAREGVR